MSLFFYNVFLLLYKLGILLVSPWNTKARLWIRGRKNIFQNLEKAFAHECRPVIWMHCASLGEFEQGRPVLESIRSAYPGIAVLLTFFSASGFEASKNYKGADYIFYLPLESKKNAIRFIRLVKPQLVLWVKYEFWFYYLKAVSNENISLLLISSLFRKHQAFFKWYKGIYVEMLNCFTHLFVQDETSRDLLLRIGYAKTITVNGDTRFDRVVEIAENFQPLETVAAFCGEDPVIVAGSTWQEDNEELDHFANSHPQIKFIIAPHEIDSSHLKDLKKMYHRSVLFSEFEKMKKSNVFFSGDADRNKANVLLIDNIGMLSRLYKYGLITFVGGGFGDGGVHNVLEAAVYGKPVIFGPVYDRYIEAVELVQEGGAFSVTTALELEEVLNRLLSNQQLLADASNASKNYVYTKKGATALILEFIREKKLIG